MNILVIEDDATTATLIKEIVSPLGDVRIALSIDDAMKEVKEAPEGSLMLWDLRLGDSTVENTAAIIRKVREDDPTARMVIVSGMPVIPETGVEAVVRKGTSMNFSRDLYGAILKALHGHQDYESTVSLMERISSVQERGRSDALRIPRARQGKPLLFTKKP